MASCQRSLQNKHFTNQTDNLNWLRGGTPPEPPKRKNLPPPRRRGSISCRPRSYGRGRRVRRRAGFLRRHGAFIIARGPPTARKPAATPPLTGYGALRLRHPRGGQVARGGVAGCRVLSVCLGVSAVLAVVLRVPLSSGSVLSRSWLFPSRAAAARFLLRCRAALAWWRRRGRSAGSSVVPSSRVPVGCLRWWFSPRWLVGGRVWLSVACSGGRCSGRRFWCRALSVWPGGRRVVR